MNKACVIGWPINHSRSPLIHNHWIRKFGLSASYESLPIPPEGLESFFDRMRQGEFVGCNVTIPHKERALQFIDQADDRVKRIGAMNTVYRKDGHLFATSTDGEGFYRNVLAHVPQLDLQNKTICVLGAGGAARAIVDRLLQESPRTIHIINRSTQRADQIAQDFGSLVRPTTFEELPEILPHCAMLVNTTSLGMAGHDRLVIPLNLLPSSAIVSDIVYVPLKTELIEQAEVLGLRAIPGLGMLLYQAVGGFELWFGFRPEITQELYEMVARDIDPAFGL